MFADKYAAGNATFVKIAVPFTVTVTLPTELIEIFTGTSVPPTHDTLFEYAKIPFVPTVSPGLEIVLP